MMRSLAVTAVTATLLSAGGIAATTTPAVATTPVGVVAVDGYSPAGTFAERYRGRFIHGWGGAHPCAFIDGVSLGLVDHGRNWYSSVVNAYETTFGVRATTRAAVRSLAGDDLQPAEPPAHCRS